MKLGDKLIGADGEETVYRVEGLIAEGERYQIAAALDESTEKQVVLRAISYGEEDDIEERREQLRREWEFLEKMEGNELLSEAVEWLEVAQSPVESTPEPILIAEYLEGKELYQWILEEYPEGLEPERALEMAAKLVDFLVKAHKERWLWRDFDPRRFLVDEEGQLRAVSLGGVVMAGAVVGPAQQAVNPTYVAPEIRDELTGTMQRPAADLYGLGALMSFMLTGEEPRERVESPLSFTAFERLEGWGLEGLELLVARLLQPLAKQRVARADRLRPFMKLDSLPERSDKGFEMTMLPAPWLGLEMENPAENRGLRSKISAGPLVSISREKSSEEAKEDVEKPPERELNWPVIIGLILFVVAAFVFTLFIGS